MIDSHPMRFDLTASDPPKVSREAVEECVGGSYWWVSRDGCGGASVPEEYAALLAPPIVVGAAACAAASGARSASGRAAGSVGRARREAAPSLVSLRAAGRPTRDERLGTRNTLELVIVPPEAPLMVPAPPRAGRHRRRG
jgi:hypothetical protein